MKTWIITDTHFWHRKLEEISERPKDFEKIIFKNLKYIWHDDVVIHLGDFCIGEDIKWHEEWNKVLPTQKRILLKGNHDKKSNSWYYDHWWHFVCETITDCYFGKNILLSHAPVDVRLNWRLNIHGHTHWNAHRDAESEDFYSDNNIEVALELNWYKPVLIEHLLC